MYTGIVSGICQVLAIENGEEICSFVVELAGHEDGLEIGASVALEGVCMTVVAIDDSQIRFDAIPETLGRTTFGSLEEGDWVNVERPRVSGIASKRICESSIATTVIQTPSRATLAPISRPSSCPASSTTKLHISSPFSIASTWHIPETIPVYIPSPPRMDRLVFQAIDQECER
jgi:hypothetical protein